MNLTQFGRVELDPTRVPIPASATKSAEPSFRERLETSFEASEPEPRPQPRDEPTEEVPLDSPEAVHRPAPEPTVPAEPREGSEGGRAQLLPLRADPQAGAEERAQGERPIASRDRGRATLEVPVVRTGGTKAEIGSTQNTTAAGTGAIDVAASASNTSAAPAQQSGQVEAKAPAESARLPRALVRAERTQPGYRTISKATVQMAEAARDSVFRQIAMRINGEGGEMRVLLDPPEIGQLDLHMVVEKGGTVHLSLIAERPELALILEKHMAELKQTLQVQGLSIGNTEVKAQQESAGNPGRSDERLQRDPEPEEGDDLSPAGFRRAGYITAEGLDFWV